MLKRYRNELFAVGACVALGLILAVLLQPRPIGLARNAGYQEQAAQYRAGGYECQPDVLERFAKSERARRAVTCKEAEEQHRLAANDLIQQWRAADAAEASSVFSFQQTRIAAYGMALGLVTMIAAIAAAFYAREAAKAAQEGLDHAAQTSRAELRAYLRSESETIFRDPEKTRNFRGVVIIKNAGATPATDVFATVSQEFRYNNGGIEELDSFNWPIGTLSPGATLDAEMRGKLDEDCERAFDAGKGSIFYEIRVRFVDNFGDSWVYSHDLLGDLEAAKSGRLGTTDCRHAKARKREEEEPNLPMSLPQQTKP
jgi:hypothetical protein